MTEQDKTAKTAQEAADSKVVTNPVQDDDYDDWERMLSCSVRPFIEKRLREKREAEKKAAEAAKKSST